MNAEGAKTIVERVLHPLSLDAFLDAAGRKVMVQRGARDHPRTTLFGSDPRASLLEAYATHAAKLDGHGRHHKAPPPQIDAVTSPDAFHRVFQSLHDQDFTVRIPDVVPLSPDLQLFARALEMLLHQPVSASIFWSKAGAGAMVHCDQRDNLVVQLSGKKRWFVSAEAPGLYNEWKQMLAPQPVLREPWIIDMEPGDLLYIPRGTAHTVESTTESLHLAILFTPVTLRDVLIAAIDQMSDLDRSFREPAIRHAGDVDERVAPIVSKAFARLAAQSRVPEFVSEAMDHRASRFVGGLPALPKGASGASLTRDTEVAHTSLAFAHVRNLVTTIDFSFPGARLSVHPGAEAALRYVSDTDRFRVRDLPGLDDAVRIALIQRLIDGGLLEVVS